MFPAQTRAWHLQAQEEPKSACINGLTKLSGGLAMKGAAHLNLRITHEVAIPARDSKPPGTMKRRLPRSSVTGQPSRGASSGAPLPPPGILRKANGIVEFSRDAERAINLGGCHSACDSDGLDGPVVGVGGRMDVLLLHEAAPGLSSTEKTLPLAVSPGKMPEDAQMNSARAPSTWQIRLAQQAKQSQATTLLGVPAWRSAAAAGAWRTLS